MAMRKLCLVRCKKIQFTKSIRSNCAQIYSFQRFTDISCHAQYSTSILCKRHTHGSAVGVLQLPQRGCQPGIGVAGDRLWATQLPRVPVDPVDPTPGQQLPGHPGRGPAEPSRGSGCAARRPAPAAAPPPAPPTPGTARPVGPAEENVQTAMATNVLHTDVRGGNSRILK